MTVEGTAIRTIFLAALTGLSFAWNWSVISSGDVELGQGLAIAGSIGGLLIGMVISFWMSSAPFLSPLYALGEGCMLAAASYAVELRYPGIAVQAAGLTIFTVIAMAMLYYMRIIRVTDTFRSIVFGATLGIALFYMVGGILSIFGIHMAGIGFTGGMLSIVVSLVIVGVAALNLALDFDTIERGSGNMPKYMEWYAAFGLLVTIIWLYLEMLRLLTLIAQSQRER